METIEPMLLTREQARDLDRRAIEEFGVPGIVLMENAGRNMAELLQRLGVVGPVHICCGKGNNGGDGFVIARHLDNSGVNVRVWVFADPNELSADAAVNYRIVERSGIAVKVFSPATFDESVLRGELASADWIVDALFGSGLRGHLQAPFDRVVTVINETNRRVFAVDIPSGLDCDTGRPLGSAVRADHTATIVAPRKGFAEREAREWVGQVHAIDIGMPRRVLRGVVASWTER